MGKFYLIILFGANVFAQTNLGLHSAKLTEIEKVSLYYQNEVTEKVILNNDDRFIQALNLSVNKAKSAKDVSDAFHLVYKNPQEEAKIRYDEIVDIGEKINSYFGKISKLTLPSGFINDVSKITRMDKYLDKNVPTSYIPIPQLDEKYKTMMTYYFLSQAALLPKDIKNEIYNQVKLKYNLSPEISKLRLEKANLETTNITNIVKERIDNHFTQIKITINNNDNKSPEQLQKEKRDDEIQKHEHFIADANAIAFLSGFVFNAIDPSGKSTYQIQKTSEGFIKLYDTIKRFGPGGFTADKLLLASNAVTAGMLVFSALSGPQKDPNVEMFKSLMSELINIQKAIERLDDKLDSVHLTMLENFEKVLNNQYYQNNKLQELQNLIRNQNELQLIKDLNTRLSKLKDNNFIYDLSLKCERKFANIKEISECKHLLTKAISKNRLDVITQGTLVPWVNSDDNINMLTPLLFSDVYSIKNDLLISSLIQPDLFMTDVSFNSFNNTNLLLAGDQALTFNLIAKKYGIALLSDIIPNSNRLIEIIKIFKNTYRINNANKDFNFLDIKSELENRVKETKNAISKISSQNDVVLNLWKDLEQNLNELNKTVSSIYSEYVNQNHDDFKKMYTLAVRNQIPHCKNLFEDGEYKKYSNSWKSRNIQIPSDQDKHFLDLLPKEAIAASSLKLGEIKNCYTADSVTSTRALRGKVPYFKIEFNIKSYFIFSSKKSVKIFDKKIQTPYRYTTYFGYNFDIMPRSWTNSVAHDKDNYDCFLKNPSGILQAFCSIVLPKSTKMPAIDFINNSIENISKEELNESILQINSSIEKVINQVVRNHAHYWDVQKLSKVNVQIPPADVHDGDEALYAFEKLSVIKTNKLQNQVDNYALHFSLMKSLFMIDLFHENPMTECIYTLNQYSIDTILKQYVSHSLDHKQIIYNLHNFIEKDLNTKCIATKIKRGLDL